MSRSWRVLGGWFRELNLHIVADDTYRVATNLDARIVGPGPIGDAKAPGVPRAGDDAALDVSAAERSAHVRAGVIDGRRLAVNQEDGDELWADGDGPAFAFLQILDFADGVKFTHAILLQS